MVWFSCFALQIRKPGVNLFAVAVRDETGNRIGSASQFVEIPDVDKGGFAISGIYLQGDLVDPSKAGAGGTTKAASENAGIRIFQPGAKFGFAYVLFNLPADQDRRSVVEVRSEILKDGVVMYTGQERAVTFEPAVEIKRRAAVGSVTLAKNMPPALYVLRVTVTDKSAPQGQTRLVQQYLDFEVRSCASRRA